LEELLRVARPATPNVPPIVTFDAMAAPSAPMVEKTETPPWICTELKKAACPVVERDPSVRDPSDVWPRTEKLLPTDKCRPTSASPTKPRPEAPITPPVDRLPPIFTLPKVDRRPYWRVELLIFMAKPCVFVTATVLIEVEPFINILLAERLPVVRSPVVMDETVSAEKMETDPWIWTELQKTAFCFVDWNSVVKDDK